MSAGAAVGAFRSGPALALDASALGAPSDASVLAGGGAMGADEGGAASSTATSESASSFDPSLSFFRIAYLTLLRSQLASSDL